MFFCLFVVLSFDSWVFIALWGLSLVAVSGGYSLRCGLLMLQSMGFSCADFSTFASWTLKHRLSSCGKQASWSKLDLPVDWTHVSCIGMQIPYHWATREAGSCYFIIRYFSNILRQECVTWVRERVCVCVCVCGIYRSAHIWKPKRSWKRALVSPNTIKNWLWKSSRTGYIFLKT